MRPSDLDDNAANTIYRLREYGDNSRAGFKIVGVPGLDIPMDGG